MKVIGELEVDIDEVVAASRRRDGVLRLVEDEQAADRRPRSVRDWGPPHVAVLQRACKGEHRYDGLTLVIAQLLCQVPCCPASLVWVFAGDLLPSLPASYFFVIGYLLKFGQRDQAVQATINSHTDIDSYASSILDFVNTNINSVTTLKQITTFPSQKPWMNREVHLLLKACDTTFRSGDAQAYSLSRANLKRGIRQLSTATRYGLSTSRTTLTPDTCGKASRLSWTTNPPTPPTQPVMPPSPMSFYVCFDRDNQEVAIKVVLPADHQPLTLSSIDVCAALSRINESKAIGLDGIPGRGLRICAGQLTEVLTDIFNLSLAQAVPTCFKTTSIVPVPKHPTAVSLNDFRPFAFTPTISKCYERLVDALQFAYCQTRITEDAISTALHSNLSHLDNSHTYMRMLFIDFSSAFSTIIPSKLITKLW
ncbi:hypothetical protein N1851_027167 [Merluccius polli]|uniref:Reverse transcriptase domain-containing protein n=1 Tax=Merluccius polli TaxID=89951 RepID=A0AA47MAG3_MERPO|nr:hypothetical protein N1851_027167 [Merluccius polli]